MTKEEVKDKCKEFYQKYNGDLHKVSNDKEYVKFIHDLYLNRKDLWYECWTYPLIHWIEYEWSGCEYNDEIINIISNLEKQCKAQYGL